jgi:hypothetical protein
LRANGEYAFRDVDPGTYTLFSVGADNEGRYFPPAPPEPPAPPAPVAVLAAPPAPPAPPAPSGWQIRATPAVPICTFTQGALFGQVCAALLGSQ